MPPPLRGPCARLRELPRLRVAEYRAEAARPGEASDRSEEAIGSVGDDQSAAAVRAPRLRRRRDALLRHLLRRRLGSPPVRCECPTLTALSPERHAGRGGRLLAA